jgi:hemerythrin-like domain-containing protein
MKRHPSLRPLSDDHHRVLVLARRLRRTDSKMNASDLEALSREVRLAFDTELEPHFRVEERSLLPALEAKGADDLVQRTLDDHVALRELIRGAWSGDTAAALGTLLEKHVRFEERVLFRRAEEILSEADLSRVHDTCVGRS